MNGGVIIVTLAGGARSPRSGDRQSRASDNAHDVGKQMGQHMRKQMGKHLGQYSACGRDRPDLLRLRAGPQLARMAL